MIENKTIAAKVLFKENIQSIPKMIDEWNEIGIKESFALKNLFTDSLYQNEIKNSDIKSWVIIQTFLNTSKTENIYSVLSDGSKAIGKGDGSWLHMICPNGGPNHNSKNSYLETVIDNIKNLVSNYNPYGINLDFIRYFVFWENVYANTTPYMLPQSCFCDRCISLFTSQFKVSIPLNKTQTKDKSQYILDNYPNEWATFKADTITSVVKRIVNSIREIKPDIKFNIHGIPWKKDDFDGAIKRIVGQDFKTLGNIVNGISPMCYSQMLKRDAKWIHEIIADLKKQTNVKVLPAIQCVEMYNSGNISDSQFEEIILESLKAPSDGIAFWPWESISNSHKNVIRKILKS